MKSMIFSWACRLSSLAMLMAALPFHAGACGPYEPIIPTPKFFTSNWEGLLNRDFDKQENLRLWQELTSSKIPLEDIEQAVYEDDKETVDDILTDATYRGEKVKTNNLFYVYLQNARDAELLYFLYVAKDLEEKRKKKTHRGIIRHPEMRILKQVTFKTSLMSAVVTRETASRTVMLCRLCVHSLPHANMKIV